MMPSVADLEIVGNSIYSKTGKLLKSCILLIMPQIWDMAPEVKMLKIMTPTTVFVPVSEID